MLPARAGAAETVAQLSCQSERSEANWKDPVEAAWPVMQGDSSASVGLTKGKMKHRLLRVNELLKRELSALLVREMDFDDVLVTVNQVDVTPDLKSAHVYVSVLGENGRTNVIAELEEARAMLQHDLSKHVILKYTPHLIFHLDDSIERGSRVLEILQEIEPPPSEEKKE
jgi:ribosome-binding factor A